MNIYRNIIALVVIFSTLMVMTGCATGARNLAEDNTLKIERVASKTANVKEVAAYQIDSEVSVWDSVKRYHSGRAPMKGHVDAQLIEPSGQSVVKIIVPYYRTTSKEGKANFHFTLRSVPSLNSTLRLTHHNAPMHESQQSSI